MYIEKYVCNYFSLDMDVWIDRGVVPWPSHSPLLAPIDFSVCFYKISNFFYNTPLLKSISELKSEMSIELCLISVNMLTNV